MPLFKVWSGDKKFVVAENFAELVFKGKQFCCIFWTVALKCLEGGGFEALTGGAFDRLN